MTRVFYPQLLDGDSAMVDRAKQIGPQIYELSEFIVDVLGIDDLSKFANPNAASHKVTYHEACHLRREIGAKTQARTLIRSLPGIDLVELEQPEVCCGFGGVFSVKFPDISGAMLQDKIDDITNTNAESVISCDSSCLMHIGGGLEKQNAGVRPMHLAQLIDLQISG